MVKVTPKGSALSSTQENPKPHLYPLGRKSLEMAHVSPGGFFQTLIDKILQLFSSLAVGHIWRNCERLTSPNLTMLLVGFLSFQENAFLTREGRFGHTKKPLEGSNCWPDGVPLSHLSLVWDSGKYEP